MDEADIRLGVQHLMNSLGFWPYHPPDDTPVATPAQIQNIIKTFNLDGNAFGKIHNILKPPTWRRESVSLSRPDIYGLNPRGPTAVIECKVFQPKVKIEAWIHPSIISDGQRQWLDTWHYQADGHGFLAIGSLDQPRRLWVVPWEEWVQMEKELAEKVVDFHIKESNLLPDYELVKITDGWQLPDYHPLLPLALETSSPNRLDWKKQYSFRFTPKKEDA
jgi:hypothetical protein